MEYLCWAEDNFLEKKAKGYQKPVSFRCKTASTWEEEASIANKSSAEDDGWGTALMMAFYAAKNAASGLSDQVSFLGFPWRESVSGFHSSAMPLRNFLWSGCAANLAACRTTSGHHKSSLPHGSEGGVLVALVPSCHSCRIMLLRLMQRHEAMGLLWQCLHIVHRLTRQQDSHLSWEAL
jgi:hypothetical protein